MAEVLYRKYRSQDFDSLYGQEHITRVLKNAVKSGKLSHAYLFVGSRGTGKTSTARILAKAVNCEHTKDGNPCNRCERCQSVNNGGYMDLVEIDAASNRGIEQIRELKTKLEFLPTEGDYKVYIIDEVHMLTAEAFNALLKTLEEPPAHVIFILATTDVHKLPPTILSRCQRYDFKLASDEMIQEYLLDICRQEGIALGMDALKVLAENAHGSYRDALSLLDVVFAGLNEQDNDKTNGKLSVDAETIRSMLGLPDLSYIYRTIEYLHANDATGLLQLLEELESRGVNASQYVKQSIAQLRLVLVALMKGENLPDPLIGLEGLSIGDVKQWIYALIRVEREIKDATYEYLPLELFVAGLLTENGALRQGEKDVSRPVSTIGSRSSDKESDSSDVSRTENSPVPTNFATTKTQVGGGGKWTQDTTETEVTGKSSPDDDIIADIENRVMARAVSKVLPKGPDKSSSKNDGTDIVPDMEDTIKDLDIDGIKAGWKDVVANVKIHNSALASILANVEVAGFDNAVMTLHVPFAFHKEQMETVQTRELLNEVSRSVYECVIPYQCVVDEGLRTKVKKSSEKVLQSIKKTQAMVENKSAQVAKSVKADSEPASRGVDMSAIKPQRKTPKRKVSKKVEAIFAGL